MPPRHAYWTIIFGNQPTSFRAATTDELMPTFRQLQTKHPDAVMMWFARGRLWKSPEEAREALAMRRAPHRFRDERPAPPSGWRAPRESRPKTERDRPQWREPRPKTDPTERPTGPAGRRDTRDKPPKGPAGGHGSRDERPKGPAGWRGERDPRPKGPRERTDRDRSEWRDRRPPRHDAKRQDDRRGPDAKRQDERRGRDWRPGGSHADPRDRFKVPRDVKRKRFAQRLRRDATSPRPSNRNKKKDEDK